MTWHDQGIVVVARCPVRVRATVTVPGMDTPLYGYYASENPAHAQATAERLGLSVIDLKLDTLVDRWACGPLVDIPAAERFFWRVEVSADESRYLSVTTSIAKSIAWNFLHLVASDLLDLTADNLGLFVLSEQHGTRLREEVRHIVMAYSDQRAGRPWDMEYCIHADALFLVSSVMPSCLPDYPHRFCWIGNLSRSLPCRVFLEDEDRHFDLIPIATASKHALGDLVSLESTLQFNENEG